MIVSLETYSNLCDRGSQHLRVIQTCEGKTEADKRYLGEVRLQSAFSSLQRFLARSSVAFPRPLSLLIGRHPYRSCSHSAFWNFRIVQLRTILRPHCAFLEKSYRDTITQALALTTAGSVPVPTLDATANS
ncbi:hypothetical protein DTO212C5_3016 [Paecilomyces variotii]|nr:hypothetical protein DTO212C5_3016 [Paecilomyces variotii]KAJ9292091.1 hypothetical protein DTO021C3_531 [Paecilomyces variotii]